MLIRFRLVRYNETANKKNRNSKAERKSSSNKHSKTVAVEDKVSKVLRDKNSHQSAEDI